VRNPAASLANAQTTDIACIQASQLPPGYPTPGHPRPEQLEQLAVYLRRLHVETLSLNFGQGSYATIFWGICETLNASGFVSFTHLRKARRSYPNLYRATKHYFQKATPAMLRQMLEKRVNDRRNTHICAIYCVSYGELANWDRYKELYSSLHVDSTGKKVARKGLFQKITRLYNASIRSPFGLDMYSESNKALV